MGFYPNSTPPQLPIMDTTEMHTEEVAQQDEKKAVRKPRAPTKKQPSLDIELLAPGVGPAAKAVRRYGKIEEDQLMQKLVIINNRLAQAKDKYIRALKEQLAIKAALLLKTDQPVAPKEAKEVHISTLDVFNVLSHLIIFAIVYLTIYHFFSHI